MTPPPAGGPLPPPAGDDGASPSPASARDTPATAPHATSQNRRSDEALNATSADISPPAGHTRRVERAITTNALDRFATTLAGAIGLVATLRRADAGGLLNVHLDAIEPGDDDGPARLRYRLLDATLQPIGDDHAIDLDDLVRVHLW